MWTRNPPRRTASLNKGELILRLDLFAEGFYQFFIKQNTRCNPPPTKIITNE